MTNAPAAAIGERDAGGLRVVLRQTAPIPLDAQFACAPGELLALVGPSGSGKSTLLRCIAGLHRTPRGTIACNGETWFDSEAGIDLGPQRRAVGLVFQHYALFPHLSAQANVMMALKHLAPRQRRQQARDWLARMHLAGLEDRYPAQLSGGQQQRVAVARALAREPSVLLLDEPFSAVDQVTRRKLQLELARLRESLKIPVVLVTHDLDEARLLADRLTILHHGVTLHSAATEEVLLRPRNIGVARLVGLSNLFEGEISGHGPDGSLCLEWRGYALNVRGNCGFMAGERVEWVVAPDFVVLHRRDRPSRGDRENPVRGVVTELLPLGPSANVNMAVDGDAAVPLTFAVPTHVARRNGLALGAAITVSLLAEGIHLMRPLAVEQKHAER